MTYDAGNRKDIRRAEKLAKQAERNRVDYTKRIMSEVLGREWMHTLLIKCSIFSTPFVRGASDITSFNCGSQNVGLQIFADVVTHCPTQYILMMQEASHKEITENVRHDGNNGSPGGELNGSADGGRDVEGPEPGDYDPFAGDEA
jgi:hypothetical protein